MRNRIRNRLLELHGSEINSLFYLAEILNRNFPNKILEAWVGSVTFDVYKRRVNAWLCRGGVAAEALLTLPYT